MFAVLKAIKTAQAANGMRHSEYERYRPPQPILLRLSNPPTTGTDDSMYRAYCSRRVHRVRKSVKLMHGRGKYTKKEIDANTVKDPR